MSFAEAVRRQAEKSYGPQDEASIRHYVDYWTGTITRNANLWQQTAARVCLPLRGRSVLDLGCGTAGLAALVTAQGGSYVGLDYYDGMMDLAGAFLRDVLAGRQGAQAALTRASAHRLPFADASFDYITAFDVVEHLVGGVPWQRAYFHEVRRVLKPDGLLLMTTPNRLWPRDGHTFVVGVQYLPTALADLYLRWRNPGFLHANHSFGNIKLLTPWTIRRLLREAGLAPLFAMPDNRDLPDYRRSQRRWLALLDRLGLAWWTTEQFWLTCARRQALAAWQQKRLRPWADPPAPQPPEDLAERLPGWQNELAWDKPAHESQLGPGWHGIEEDERGLFRWTAGRAVFYLRQPPGQTQLVVEGRAFPLPHSPTMVVDLRFDGALADYAQSTAGGDFRVCAALPPVPAEGGLLTVEIESRYVVTAHLAASAYVPDDVLGNGDMRRLGVQVRRIALAPLGKEG